MEFDFSNRELYNYKYIWLLRNKKRYLFLMWGGGSWKSKFTAQKEIIKTFESWNRLLWVRKVKDTIKDSVFAELTGVIDDWRLNEYFTITTSPMRIINNLTWSDCIFRWLDDVEKIKSVKWVTRVWLEEATEADKKDFDQLDIRLRWEGKELQMTCTYNPISDQHWLITDFWVYGSTQDVECLHSTYKDNRFVGQEQYDKVMERLKLQDINLYNIYALGIPGKAVEGLIFTYENISEIPEEAKYHWPWLDFWYNDPTALVDVYEWNGAIILDERLYKRQMTNRDIIDFLRKEDVKNHIEIVWDNSRPESIEEIHRAGFFCVPCTKWPDSIIHGINTMKAYKIYITARSQNLRKEFDNYVWAKDKNGNAIEKPIDDFNHGIDAARYKITKVFWNIQEFFTWFF